MRTLALALLVATTSGCPILNNGNFNQLPERDRDLFHRCAAKVQPNICDSPGVVCIAFAEAQYADAVGDTGRKLWLLSAGCPPYMVNPGAYVGPAQSEDAPIHPRPSAPAAPGQAADSE